MRRPGESKNDKNKNKHPHPARVGVQGDSASPLRGVRLHESTDGKTVRGKGADKTGRRSPSTDDATRGRVRGVDGGLDGTGGEAGAPPSLRSTYRGLRGPQQTSIAWTRTHPAPTTPWPGAQREREGE